MSDSGADRTALQATGRSGAATGSGVGGQRPRFALLTAGTSSSWRHRAELVAPPALWAVLACYLYSAFLAHPTSGVPGGPDGILYCWYFQWIEHSVVHGVNPLSSPAMNAPGGVSVMWNTAVLLVAFLCVPLTASIGAIATVGLMMVLSPVLAASTAYFVFRSITGRALGSALCASLYGFGPFFVGQQGHLHLTMAAPVLPLVLLAGYRLLVEQRASAVRTGIWFGCVIAAAMLISEEVVALAALVSAFSVLMLLLVGLAAVRSRLRYAVTGLGVAVLVTLALTAIPLGYQFFGPRALRNGVTQSNQQLDLSGIVRPSGLMRFAAHSDVLLNRRFHANGVENTGYLGWPLVLVVVAALVLLAWRRDRFAYWWAGTTAVTVLFSLGSYIRVNGKPTSVTGPWHWFSTLPVLKGVIVVRFTQITTLLVALLLAWTLSRLGSRLNYRIGLVIVALAFVPLIPAHRYGEILRPETPRFFTTASVNTVRGSTVYLMPQGRSPFLASQTMYWQIKAGMRFNLVGGYSVFEKQGRSYYHGTIPPFAQLLQTASDSGVTPSPRQLSAARESLADTPVNYIVITAQQYNRQFATRLAGRLTGCTPRQVADVTVCQLRHRSGSS